MSSTREILRRGFGRLGTDGISVLIPLVIGVVVARIIVMIASIALFLVLALVMGNGQPMLLATIVFLVSGMLGTALLMVAVGSATRSAMTSEASSELRAYGIAAIPSGLFAMGLIMVAGMVGGPIFGALVAIPVLWALVLATVDIACEGTGSGFGAAWSILTRAPGPLLGVVAAGTVTDALVVAAALAFPIVLPLASVPSLLLRIMLSIDLYGSVFDLPQAQLDRAATEYGLSRSEARASLPSWMQAADEDEVEVAPATGAALAPSESGVVRGIQLPPVATATAHPATSAAPPAVVPNVGGSIALTQESPYGVGAWVPFDAAGALLLQLDAATDGAATAVCVCDQHGTWGSLTRQPAGSWGAAMPAGPWFVAVQGAAAGASATWSVQPTASVEVAA